MTTIDILDRYRKSIMSNQYYSLILTYVYYKGRCVEEDITHDLRLDKSNVFNIVKELFVDGFLRKSNNFLKVTKKTISVLEELDFGKYISELLLTKELKSQTDFPFFLAYLYSDLNKNTNSPATINLRNVKTAIKLVDNRIGDKKKNEIYWTVIIGNDELLKATDDKTFVKKIMRFHSENDTELWKKYQDILLSNEKYYNNRCYASRLNYFSVNEIIVDENKPSDSNFEIIYLTRLLNCLEDELFDSDLQHIIKVDNRTVMSSISKLRFDNARLEKYCKKLVSTHDYSIREIDSATRYPQELKRNLVNANEEKPWQNKGAITKVWESSSSIAEQIGNIVLFLAKAIS